MSSDPLPKDAPLEALAAEARSACGSDPEWAAAAPGRVNLIGDHTDYNEGFVLPMAIDRWVVAAAARAPTGRTVLRSTAVDEALEVGPAATLRPIRGHWANPALGVLAEIARAGHALPALDIALAGDVPIGAGLASSAAVEVAVATLVESVLGTSFDGLEKASLCRRAEHAFTGTPCGIMDMLVSIAARPGAALLIDCRDLATEPVPLPDAAAVLVVDSGVRRTLAESAYAERRAACRRAAGTLGVPSLRDVDREMLKSPALAAEDRRRAVHVVTENQRTLQTADALREGRLEDVGRLMIESHASLRDLFEVSCRELDSIVTAAAATPGALGARMTGAGFGGCAIVLCRAEAASAVQAELTRALRTGSSPAMFVARAVGGARAL